MSVTTFDLLCDQDALQIQRMSVLASGSQIVKVTLADIRFTLQKHYNSYMTLYNQSIDVIYLSHSDYVSSHLQ